MEENVNIIKMKPEFIYLDNGVAISTDNIVSIDEFNSKVIFGYGVAMYVTGHDIDVIKENIDIINDEPQCHCGQDADMDDACCQAREQQESGDVGMSLKDLLGMTVVGVGKGKCDGCPMDHYQADCAKVELVGGDYICLAKPRPEEEDGDNVMGDIREKAEAFIDYLDSVIGD